ncbi:phenylserine dehydratase isoform X1 [Anguilla anguilla]|uniref:phenylserine dehydratase isoform X1 n=1 Tax=Anguilla anguilla TaxID=7936 RepID=UPI0015AB4686|nr:phenylserine dehydratase isoform X1 [Anguilla anguilla]
MEDTAVDLITLQMLQAAQATVRASPLGVINTPMIPGSQTTLPLNTACDIHIKMENLQRTGSFKIRGVANQFARRPAGGRFVTMSAGNYGKSFAYATKHYGTQGKVVMPETAPPSRSVLIQSFGVEVERVPTSRLVEVVNRCVRQENMTFLHPHDDVDLIAGHASVGLEILEAVPNPDVVVVCCGGGGLLAGVAAAVKLSGCENARVYGVEPTGACTMFRSFAEGRPVEMDAKSIAAGLAPPSAGNRRAGPALRRSPAVRPVPAVRRGDRAGQRRGDRIRRVHAVPLRLPGGTLRSRGLRRRRQRQDPRHRREDRGAHPERRKHRQGRAGPLPRLSQRPRKPPNTEVPANNLTLQSLQTL